MSIYDYSADLINGEKKDLSDFKGKVILVVNTASKCDFVNQYNGLEDLYKSYKAQGLVVLAFPCNQFLSQEPGSNEEIDIFCKKNFGITFPLFEKVKVNGPEAHPIFRYLKNNATSYLFKGEKTKQIKRIKSLLKKHYPEFLNNNEIKWNFTKFLVNREGEVYRRYEPTFTPVQLEDEITSLL